MWCLWLKSGNTWIEASKGFVEESDARAEAQKLKTLFHMDQVFIQFDEDFPEEIK